MLHRVILSPSIFSSIQNSTSKIDKATFSLIYRMLEDLLENCVVVFDSENYIQDIDNLVQQLPISYRKKLQVLIQMLRKEKRFAKISANCNASDKTLRLHYKSCSYLINILMDNPSIPFIASDECCIGGTGNEIDILEYNQSKFSNFRRETKSFYLENGEWSKKEFEDKVLIPILRETKIVKLVDRYIGRSMTEKSNIMLKPEYEEVIEWIAKIFVEKSICKKKEQRIIEIYTGTLAKKEEVLRKIKEKAEIISKKFSDSYGSQVKLIFIKEEKKNKSNEMDNKLEETANTRHQTELPHGRYLITQQVGIQIDRGFNLLFSDKLLEEDFLPEDEQNEQLICDTTVVIDRKFKHEIMRTVNNMCTKMSVDKELERLGSYK